jgi:uncharacterized protein (TIGR02099 family)
MHIPSLFTRLAALAAAPRLRRPLRVLAWTAVALYFTLALLVIVLRHFVLPGVDEYRGDIERNLSQALARPVAIRSIDAHWRRIWPNLHIHGLEILDTEGRSALTFDEVEVDIAWSSLWRLAPHFARLEIKAPRLDLRRDASGKLFVAGLEVATDDNSGSGFLDWLQSQDRIVVRDATVTWNDDLRHAPPLALAHVNFDLRNGGSRHRFGLTAEPPLALATRLDIRGDFRGDGLDALDTWKGEAYVELDYADLSGWRAWVDYPIDLPHGNGGMRLWLAFDHQSVTGATADVRLGRTIARLAPKLPMLDMERLEGRLTVKRLGDGYSFQTRHLALATRDGIRIEPSDIDLRWQPATESAAAHGEASANGVDVGALAALASYLPLDEGVRKELVDYGPRGRLHDLQLAWTGEPGALATYRVKGRFEDLSLHAQGAVPGFSGLDGRIDGNEKGGTLKLATRNAMIELPAIFEQPTVELAALDASADWTVREGLVEVRLPQATFQNADAAGEASGLYRSTGSGPGEIDLSAKLSRADGASVWRYMPLVVGKDVREWLHESISGGAATASLRLKGDLAHFPFTDGSGIFEVKGLFQGATLRYVVDWPAFEDVSGSLQFVGAGMLIHAQRAKLWNVQLNDVKAGIANLDAQDVDMAITGSARGPTADFLRFIDESPVSGYIDHVTDGMKAGGNGELHLRLDMPLRHIDNTRVDGRYRLMANDLVYDSDLPPASEINGELRFTEKGLEAKKIRGVVLGAPAFVDIGTEDGHVALQASGSASVAALRQRYGYPVFEHLAGSTPWSASVRVKKRAAEVRVESSLQGISSSLPDPFNKTAGDAMPLTLAYGPASEPSPARDKRSVADKSVASRYQLDVSLGDALRAQLVRRADAGRSVVERGVIAVSRPDARLPDRGVLLAAGATRLDADFWRRMAGGGSGAATNGNGGGGVPVSQVDLRADELRVFGRPIHALQLTGALEGDTWKMDVKSREATGRLEWTSRGNTDRLLGRLARLDVPENDAPTSTSPTVDSTDRLPAIDLTVDRFLVHGREMGELRLDAENLAGVWKTRFRLKNEDGDLDGTGRWQMPQPGIAANTAIDFTLNANSVERTLDRLGYVGAMRRGTATLSGALAWAGAPTSIDYPSLNGKLTLEARRGQFRKLDPGVGRLLGILSLQSLPRRISLDFRDIFSEGFAYDSIDGHMAINRGVIETSDLEIDGPAATVLMNGTVNVVNETQDLKVRVQPTFGETVATGVLLINPVVGATAWVMNKVFGNPLDKVFAFDYAVTGSWVDPKVEKVAAQGPGLTQRPDAVAP